jgi:hypothetical protein
MPVLRLISIKCIRQEDWTGDDSAYLVVNGTKVWGRESMDDDQTRLINKDVLFNRRASLKLMEHDWPDNDDFLGEHLLTRADIDKGEQEIKFTEDDADYTVWLEVLRSPMIRSNREVAQRMLERRSKEKNGKDKSIERRY